MLDFTWYIEPEVREVPGINQRELFAPGRPCCNSVVPHASEFSNAILWVFFLLTSRKLRAGRSLVQQLKRHESAVS